MNLTGEISSARPLLVLATTEEAAHLAEDFPVLLTGMGKVNAAAALAAVLGRGDLPSAVVNLGTAGALSAVGPDVYEVGTVVQHDLDTAALRALTGESYGLPLKLTDEGPTLATGDSFIADSSARERLAARADLVDMEGYALAHVSLRAQVPVRLVKHVSDSADEGAGDAWRRNVDNSARALADWVRANLR
ncbi:nucleosidase [Nocardia sp. NPDC059177]|uniref:nucleosidase n=1 Tax=Nocardia sp. NPDC059177 TaxID=3346759 RepID=UPI003680C8E7